MTPPEVTGAPLLDAERATIRQAVAARLGAVGVDVAPLDLSRAVEHAAAQGRLVPGGPVCALPPSPAEVLQRFVDDQGLGAARIDLGYLCTLQDYSGGYIDCSYDDAIKVWTSPPPGVDEASRLLRATTSTPGLPSGWTGAAAALAPWRPPSIGALLGSIGSGVRPRVSVLGRAIFADGRPIERSHPSSSGGGDLLDVLDLPPEDITPAERAAADADVAEETALGRCGFPAVFVSLTSTLLVDPSGAVTTCETRAPHWVPGREQLERCVCGALSTRVYGPAPGERRVWVEVGGEAPEPPSGERGREPRAVLTDHPGSGSGVYQTWEMTRASLTRCVPASARRTVRFTAALGLAPSGRVISATVTTRKARRAHREALEACIGEVLTAVRLPCTGDGQAATHTVEGELSWER